MGLRRILPVPVCADDRHLTGPQQQFATVLLDGEIDAAIRSVYRHAPAVRNTASKTNPQ
jgi:hypothetical protein